MDTGGDVLDAGVRARERWDDASAWIGDGLRREIFFFDSGGEQLYGSLYSSAELSRPFGVIACNSWGVEADRSEPLLRSVAIEMARLGGAGLVFHYPGYGDSYGDLTTVDLAQLTAAAADAVAEGSRRLPGLAWILAGFMLGAAVASLAQRRVDLCTLLLVQPALRPAAYFNSLSKRTEPLPRNPGPSPNERMEVGAASGMAYGYPIPHRIAEIGGEADAAVAAALAEFEGEGAVVMHAEPDDPPPVPGRFEMVHPPGTWRFGSLNNPRLARGTVDWLDRRTAGGGR